jgi:8-oxo-dGTP diphosphatase
MLLVARRSSSGCRQHSTYFELESIVEYKHPIATVDVVMFTLKGGRLHIVLVRRDKEPFAGQLALPGGYVHTESDPNSRGSARRMLEQKTGIKAPYLEQLYTFSGPDRDPRGWSFSVTYYALVNEELLAKQLTGLVELVPVDEIPTLAFDHNEIVDFAIRRLGDKSSYSTLPCYLLPRKFTLTEIQAAYELVLRTKLNPSSFRRKLEDLSVLELVENEFREGKHRPAQLFRIKREKDLTIFDRTV